MSPAYIYGNDDCTLLANYECLLTSELYSYPIIASASATTKRFSLLLGSQVQASLLSNLTWQQSIVQAQMRAHLKQAIIVGILPSNGEEMIKFGYMPEFTVLRLKAFATALKVRLFPNSKIILFSFF